VDVAVNGADAGRQIDPAQAPVQVGELDAALDGQARARGRDVARTTDEEDFHYAPISPQPAARAQQKKFLPFS